MTHSRFLPSLVLCLTPSLVFGAGYYLPNQDALATAKGNAFVATADSPAAVFYNPAGLTQVQTPQAEIGVYSIVLGNKADIGGRSYKADTELQAAPHIYYARPLSEDWSLGIGVNSPFGLGTEWGQDTPFRQAVTEARLMYVSATAALGYRVNEQLSIGASVSGNYADLTLEQGIGPTAPGYLRYEGNDVGVSGSIGVLWQPTPQHAFGLNYSTKSEFDLEGDVRSNLLPDSHGDMDFITPARVAFGYSFRPKPGWNIEANIEWLDWDSLNTLKLKSASVGGETPVPFEWKSCFIYELGVSYTTPEGWIFAAGYDFNESAQPDQYFNPGVSDANRHWLNAGFGRRYENQSWFLAYQFGFSDRTVNDSVIGTNGDYKARHNALLLSYTRQF
ncbi:MAG: outer membrane protein transport protein [Luteolibacter sp.]